MPVPLIGTSLRSLSSLASVFELHVLPHFTVSTTRNIGRSIDARSAGAIWGDCGVLARMGGWFAAVCASGNALLGVAVANTARLRKTNLEGRQNSVYTAGLFDLFLSTTTFAAGPGRSTPG